MALNKLKKWIGSQLFETFMEEYNSNVDATNAAIDLAEENAANISLLNKGVAQFTANPQATTIYKITFPTAYAAPPAVVATEVYLWPTDRLTVLVHSITTTSAEIRVHNASTSPRSTIVNWIAVG